jgi:hypothetical protein
MYQPRYKNKLGEEETHPKWYIKKCRHIEFSQAPKSL